MTDPGNGLDVNGVAHVVFRVNRIAECIAFYDQLMPFLGLHPVEPRSDDFVYYVGGRTALALRSAEPRHADAAHIETAPGIDHLCFRARRREDVDALYSFLQDMGADMVRPPTVGAGLLLRLVPRPGGHQARAQPRPRGRLVRRGRHPQPVP